MIDMIIGTVVIPLIFIAIGISLLFLIKKRLSPRNPKVGIVASIVVAVFFLRIAVSFVGIYSGRGWLGWIVLAAFVATTYVQSNPWESKSILRSLAVTSGTVALYSAFASDSMITVFALLATGLLIRLFTTPPTVEDSRTSGQSSRTMEAPYE